MEITGHPQDETAPAAEQPDPASEPDLTQENTVSAAESEEAPAVSADASAAAETPSDTEETASAGTETASADASADGIALEQPAGAAAEPESVKNPETEQTGGLRGILFDLADLAESVVTAIFVVIMLFTFLVCTATVEGDSMVPTLENDNRLLVSRIGRHYETGDILILNSATAYLFDAEGNLTALPGLDKTIVKRLIAQSGQTVDIDFDAGIVYVDGTALDEPYTNTLTKRDNRAFTYPLTIPEGYIFVLGDNRHISKDSRHPEVGLLPEESIIGKVLLRITPFSDFGRIDSTGGQQ